jgi:hypothetical protein
MDHPRNTAEWIYKDLLLFKEEILKNLEDKASGSSAAVQRLYKIVQEIEKKYQLNPIQRGSIEDFIYDGEIFLKPENKEKAINQLTLGIMDDFYGEMYWIKQLIQSPANHQKETWLKKIRVCFEFAAEDLEEHFEDLIAFPEYKEESTERLIQQVFDFYYYLENEEYSRNIKNNQASYKIKDLFTLIMLYQGMPREEIYMYFHGKRIWYLISEIQDFYNDITSGNVEKMYELQTKYVGSLRKIKSYSALKRQNP